MRVRRWKAIGLVLTIYRLLCDGSHVCGSMVNVKLMMMLMVERLESCCQKIAKTVVVVE